MEIILSAPFWIAVGQIIMIDILLGGDNAIVIALACRKLPPSLRVKGIIWGTAGAVILRVVLIFFALQLLAIPFLKLIGGVLLVWIGIKLLLPEEDNAHENIAGSERLWGAIKTVIVADLVMSVDNVIAIAGAAETAGGQHTMPLVIFGLLVSIPIIVWGSQLVLKLMDRFPMVTVFGAMLLGWIAGTMAITDPVFTNSDVMTQIPKFTVSPILKYAAGIIGALLVLTLGKLIFSKKIPHPL
jgi:YjbE family integral membrane protein